MKKTNRLASIILVGGFGTRLRPLTLHRPKAILPVLNRPFLAYQLDILGRAGVRDVFLAAGHHAQHLAPALKKFSLKNMRIHFVLEPKPMGTGGAIRFAYDALKKKIGVPVAVTVFNGDILFELDLKRFWSFHRQKKSLCSIALTPVEDPSRFGVVEMRSSGQISKFIEKPQNYKRAAYVNAGAYLFDPALLEKIPKGKPISVEREVYPKFLNNKEPMFAYRMKGYWNDIGTPQTYLKAHLDLLGATNLWTQKTYFRKRGDRFLRSRSARVLLGKQCSIAKGVRFEGVVCLGDRVRIERNAIIQNSIIYDGSVIGEGTKMIGSIVGLQNKVGSFSDLQSGTVLGDKTILSSFTRC